MKEGKKPRLSFRGYETTVIMSQELGKHMLVCCCWNRGALLRLRFGNMKDFVGWAGGLALIQALIAREAGSELQLWDRERNLVTYSREDRSSKQTQSRGCWANHSATLSALNPPHSMRWGTRSHLTGPQRRPEHTAQEWRGSGSHRSPKLHRDPVASECRDLAAAPIIWTAFLFFFFLTKQALCCFIAAN